MLYDSKLHLFPSKLKSRWTGSFIIHQVHPNGSVDLLNSKDSRVFKVNGQRLKPYAIQFAIDDSCHSRVIRNQQNLYPKFLLLP